MLPATCPHPPLARNPPPTADGDGVVSLKEFEDNLFPKTRKKIENKLDSGWTFDKKLWMESIARHAGD